MSGHKKEVPPPLDLDELRHMFVVVIAEKAPEVVKTLPEAVEDLAEVVEKAAEVVKALSMIEDLPEVLKAIVTFEYLPEAVKAHATSEYLAEKARALLSDEEFAKMGDEEFSEMVKAVGPVENFAGVFASLVTYEDLPEVVKALAKAIEDLAEAFEALETETVESWAERWNLAAPWLIDHARATRALWRRNPGVDRLDLWCCSSGGKGHRITSAEFRVRWDPRLPEVTPGKKEGEWDALPDPSGAAARQRVLDGVNDYFDRQEEAAKRDGFERLNLHRRHERTPFTRLGWVVMWRCKGVKGQRIAKREKVHRSSVEAEVKKLSEMLDLPPM